MSRADRAFDPLIDGCVSLLEWRKTDARHDSAQFTLCVPYGLGFAFFLLFIYFIFFALATLFRVIYSARYSRSWHGGVFFCFVCSCQNRTTAQR